MHKVVLDANQYVSAALIAGSNSWKALDAARRGIIQLLVSPAIAEEVRRVFNYPKIFRRHGLSPEQIDRYLQDIWDCAVFVFPTETLCEVKLDDSDNRYLECAVAGGADCIVSGDRHLLTVKEFQGILILDAAGFLARLERG